MGVPQGRFVVVLPTGLLPKEVRLFRLPSF